MKKQLPAYESAQQATPAGAAPTPANYIIHHGAQSGYDVTARQKLTWFLNHWPKRRQKVLVTFLNKTKQTVEAFDAFVLINRRIIAFRKTAEEVYQDALNWDMEMPSYVRIWRRNNLMHYVCAPEFSIYADYNYNELWDDNGRLKQEVKDEAIRELKSALLVGKETDNL